MDLLYTIIYGARIRLGYNVKSFVFGLMPVLWLTFSSTPLKLLHPRQVALGFCRKVAILVRKFKLYAIESAIWSSR